MKKACSIVVGIVFILTLSGCDLLPLPNKSSSPKVPVVTKSTGPTLARMNDWVLTIDEFDNQVDVMIRLNDSDANIPVSALGIVAGTFIPAQIEKIDLSSIEGKKFYLDLLINQELLAQEAEARGLDRSPEVVKGIRKSSVEILGFTLLNDTLKDVKVTPIEVEDLYNNEYKKTLESIERRKIREIVVNSDSKAKDVLIEILTLGDFPGVATRNSIVETALVGGLLKINDQEYIVPQQGVKFNKFWNTAFTLDKGGVSNVFKNPDKKEYYIVKVEDIQKGVPKSLNEVYNDLEYILLRQKTMSIINELMGKVKTKFEADLVINSNLIN